MPSGIVDAENSQPKVEEGDYDSDFADDESGEVPGRGYFAMKLLPSIGQTTANEVQIGSKLIVDYMQQYAKSMLKTYTMKNAPNGLFPQLVMLDVVNGRARRDERGLQFQSHANAECIAHHITDLLQNDQNVLSATDIGVAVMHNAQASLIKSLLTYNLEDDIVDQISIDHIYKNIAQSSIDSRKGKQREVVFLDLVVSGHEKVSHVGHNKYFVNEEESLETALSRAKSSLIIVGNVNGIMSCQRDGKPKKRVVEMVEELQAQDVIIQVDSIFDTAPLCLLLLLCLMAELLAPRLLQGFSGGSAPSIMESAHSGRTIDEI
jgi:hypothetical protein